MVDPDPDRSSHCLNAAAAYEAHGAPELGELARRLSSAPLGDALTNRWQPSTPLLVIAALTVFRPPGSFVALVGPSGAGKPTLLRVMLGFELPWEGEVLLDGRSLSGLHLEAVRRQMGTFIQGARVTSGSLLANIVGSLPVSSDAAWKAAELAGVAADIRVMPMGMSTLVPEGGTGFSGGQLQRILLARALVRSPRILLLDEATSQLDNETQRIVSEHLAGLGVTRVVVAHRLSTIRRADHIVVLDQGRVVEQGQHDELLAAGGLFATLARRQTL